MGRHREADSSSTPPMTGDRPLPTFDVACFYVSKVAGCRRSRGRIAEQSPPASVKLDLPTRGNFIVARHGSMHS
ncbi:conserved hypothetical protein [Ricinus communis]|uniref:Uncharacterized protein n=1 Tax=Ricinus communis TaxID=3988 RepID=B9TJN7_RICCO|nr:conserved hypothetical protein [Ricinus communis]